MMYKSTELIGKAMQENKFKYTAEEYDDCSFVTAEFRIKQGLVARVFFISTGDRNDVSIRVFKLIANVPDDKLEAIRKAVNTCNVKYAFLKFEVDKDNCVNITYDMPAVTSDGSVGGEAVEIFVRIIQILNECYPAFMKALWN